MDYMNDVYPLQADLSYLPEIEKIPEIRSVSETAYKPGMVKSDKDVHGVMFKGVDSTYSLDFFADFLTEGTLPDFSGRRMSDQVLISKRLATMLGLSTGDRMTVYFIGEQVRARRLMVTGMYDIQLENLDEKLAVHESSCLEIALGGDGGKAADRRRIEVYDEIGEIIMDRDITADAPVVVRRIDEIYPGLFDWLALLDLNVLVVMALMMAVAGFNMISGLLIILFERISMIGLLKSLGMRTYNICKVFIYRGGAIVLKGMLWGNVAAILLLAVQKWPPAYHSGGYCRICTHADYNDHSLAIHRQGLSRPHHQGQLKPAMEQTHRSCASLPMSVMTAPAGASTHRTGWEAAMER